MRILVALVFSSGCASGVGAVLTLAVGIALGGAPPWTAATLAFSGTFVIYNVDRLRDLERDRRAHPLRSQFVENHRATLRVLCGLALAAAAFSAWGLGHAAWLLCAVVVVPGLFHRRLKSSVVGKALYVATAWVLVVVGLAAIEVSASAGGAALQWEWAAIAIAGPVFANLIASNLIEFERAAPILSRQAGLWGAALSAGTGGAVALLAAGALSALAWVALAELVTLAFHRSGEHYLGVLDGALLLGGALAIALA